MRIHLLLRCLFFICNMRGGAGLVYNVTEYLFSHGINIENLETHTEQVPTTLDSQYFWSDCGPSLGSLVYKCIKPWFIHSASSTSLTEVSKWLSSFCKLMLLLVNDVWVAKVQTANVPSHNSLFLKNSLGVVEFIKFLNIARSNAGISSPLFLHIG